MSSPASERPESTNHRLSVVESDIAVLKSDVSGIKVGQAEQNQKLDLVLSRQSMAGKPNYVAIGILLTVMGGLYALVQVPMERRITMNENSIGSMSGSLSDIAISKVNDAQSLVDRQRLNGITERLLEHDSKVDTILARMEADLGEVETQIHSLDEIRNMQTQHDHTIHSMLWQEVYKTPLPGSPYYPKISKRSLRQ